jgi:8-oxo-dGTP pyrophosphatase MutT (NUDIX family)
MSVEKLAKVEAAIQAHRPLVVTLEGSPMRAAVAMTLDPRQDDLYCFFIHRADVQGDPWSGHIAFPGGRKDDGDPDMLATVYREVREEVGVDLERSARLLGPLDEIQGVARGQQLPMVISPFLFVLREPVTPVPDAREVQSMLWVPVSFLEDSANESIVEHRINQQRLRLPAYIYQDRTIWGLTFRMVKNFLDVLARTDGGPA